MFKQVGYLGPRSLLSWCLVLCVPVGGVVVVLAVGSLWCRGVLVGVGPSRSSLRSNGWVSMFPAIFLCRPCFMVVNVALVLLSQSSMACWGVLIVLLIFISVSLSISGLCERGRSGWSIDISMS